LRTSIGDAEQGLASQASKRRAQTWPWRRRSGPDPASHLTAPPDLCPPGRAGKIARCSCSRARIGPLVLSAFIGPGYFLIWPVLIALALLGANQALGNARTALICVAGQVIGTPVSEGIVA
jgi:hypothetical protein